MHTEKREGISMHCDGCGSTALGSSAAVAAAAFAAAARTCRRFIAIGLLFLSAFAFSGPFLLLTFAWLSSFIAPSPRRCCCLLLLSLLLVLLLHIRFWPNGRFSRYLLM